MIASQGKRAKEAHQSGLNLCISKYAENSVIKTYSILRLPRRRHEHQSSNPKNFELHGSSPLLMSSPADFNPTTADDHHAARERLPASPVNLGRFQTPKILAPHRCQRRSLASNPHDQATPVRVCVLVSRKGRQQRRKDLPLLSDDNVLLIPGEAQPGRCASLNPTGPSASSACPFLLIASGPGDYLCRIRTRLHVHH